MNDELFESLTLRLRMLDACAASDAMDAHGLDGVVYGLVELSSTRRIAGRANTVTLGPDDGRATHRHLGTAAVDAGGPGCVIVIEHHARTDVAGWGGILSLGAHCSGIEGIVIDGACRDIDEARELGLPIYGRAGTPRTARGRIIELAFGEPVTICGITVSPGDYIIADGSGIVVIPLAYAETVIAGAEKIVAREKLMAEQVRAGRPIASVMGSSYEDMLKDVAG